MTSKDGFCFDIRVKMMLKDVWVWGGVSGIYSDFIFGIYWAFYP